MGIIVYKEKNQKVEILNNIIFICSIRRMIFLFFKNTTERRDWYGSTT